jgi:hypothetical protein
VEVCLLRRIAPSGSRKYVNMPSNEAQFPDIYVAVARLSHTCFYMVWCAHYHLTHPEVVAVFWQKPNIYIIKESCVAS